VKYLGLDKIKFSAKSITKKYAYSQLARQDEIAKRVYCHGDTGFMYKGKPPRGGNIYGMQYRGKGFIQLTWKTNYQAIERILKVKTPNEEGIDELVKYPNSLLSQRIGFLTALGFWEKERLNKKIENGATIEQISKIVNGGTHGLITRKKNFKNIYEILKGK
jgi:predicted chitinase